MNPPFSASPHVGKRFAEAGFRHVASALARLAPGGRLVAITGHNTGPEEPGWREAFVRLQQKARVVFTAAIAGRAYARHGTTMDTRLTVIDRIPAEDPRRFPPSPGIAARCGRAARLGRPACTAARADRRHHPPALSRRSDSPAAVAHRCAQTCAPQQAGARS